MSSTGGTIIHQIDDFALPRFLPVASAFGKDRYGFVVTPNVDHLVRCYDDPVFHNYYRAADYVLMDSRFAARIIRLVKGVRLPICTGSDLTAALFASVVDPDDRIVLIGASAEQAQLLRHRYGLHGLQHHNPPMGFIKDAAAVEACLTFVELHSPFRFCFLAVGSPQQEVLAHALGTRGVARGLAMCVGASLDFLTGAERRSPRWMQRAGIEWLYRLLRNPRRLTRRYLVRGPRFFFQIRHSKFILRGPAPP
jgi:exopolysaccharide biosynthesis WecB/TagA/CpsF family protein